MGSVGTYDLWLRQFFGEVGEEGGQSFLQASATSSCASSAP